jgi:hypothetical protein
MDNEFEVVAKKTLLETVIDIGSGFLLAVLIQILIFPYFDLHPTIFESIEIAVIFTVLSMVRSWLWRMFFKCREMNEWTCK